MIWKGWIGASIARARAGTERAGRELKAREGSFKDAEDRREIGAHCEVAAEGILRLHNGLRYNENIAYGMFTCAVAVVYAIAIKLKTRDGTSLPMN